MLSYTYHLGTDEASKTDELSKSCKGGGVIFHQKNYIAEYRTYTAYTIAFMFTWYAVYIDLYSLKINMIGNLNILKFLVLKAFMKHFKKNELSLVSRADGNNAQKWHRPWNLATLTILQ